MADPIEIITPRKSIKGKVDKKGNLTNAYGAWSRPVGSGDGPVIVWGIVLDQGVDPPPRPGPDPNNPKNDVSQGRTDTPTGDEGVWDFDKLPWAEVGKYKKLVVWLDISTSAQYYKDSEVFLGEKA